MGRLAYLSSVDVFTFSILFTKLKRWLLPMERTWARKPKAKPGETLLETGVATICPFRNKPIVHVPHTLEPQCELVPSYANCRGPTVSDHLPSRTLHPPPKHVQSRTPSLPDKAHKQSNFPSLHPNVFIVYTLFVVILVRYQSADRCSLPLPRACAHRPHQSSVKT